MFQEASKFALWEEKDTIIEGFFGGCQIPDGVRKGCDGTQKEPELSYDPTFRAVEPIGMFQDHLEFMYDFWGLKVSIARLLCCCQQIFNPRAYTLACSFSRTY